MTSFCWHTASWLYQNLDMDAFEAWYQQEAQANEAYYVETAEKWMGKARDFARECGLPLVLDDLERNIDIAKRVGMRTVHFRGRDSIPDVYREIRTTN